MTSLLGRLLPLFVGARRVEDLFTEAVARLFERRPELCLSWLDDLDLITSVSGEDQRYIRVTTQKSFVALEEHGSASRPDLIVEVYQAVEDAELESSIDVVMVESKIGSWEGQEQLRRYAEHLDKMTGTRKTLAYITRAYDPKEKEEILAGTQSTEFCQLRWHDFYRFLQTVEADALVEEVMLFMEEQGMARSYRLSTMDLMALSGVPRAFEVFDETLDGEVRTEVEAFAGNKMKRETADRGNITRLGRYFRQIPLHGYDLICLIGYAMGADDGYPVAKVQLEMRPNALRREVSRTAMEKAVSRSGWGDYRLDNP
ncbi:MAG: hypothetical protein ACR2JR_01525, partial [Rubrobacteraceae bacterium]